MDRDIAGGPRTTLHRGSAPRARASAGRAASVALGVALCLVAVSACAGGGGAGTNERYPEKKRPDAPRSASDGEVLGASQQDPADTLEGSLTTEHAAPRSPHAEEPATRAREQLEYEECIERQNEAATTAAAADGAPRKRPVCTPPPEHDH